MNVWGKSWLKPFLFFGSLLGGIIILIALIMATHLLTARYYKAQLIAQQIEHKQALEAQRLETSIDNQIEKYGQAVYDVCYLVETRMETKESKKVNACHELAGLFISEERVWNPQPGWNVERMRMESGVY